MSAVRIFHVLALLCLLVVPLVVLGVGDHAAAQSTCSGSQRC